MIELQIEQTSGLASLLQINLNGSQASPADLVDLEFPEVDGRGKGLIISGFPQYAALTVALHYKNIVGWIGIVDPKVGTEKSAVVVVTTNRAYRVGDIVPLSSLGFASPVPIAGN